MAAIQSGHVWYKRVEPAVYWDVQAFDGSVPYGVSTDGYVLFEDQGGGGSRGMVQFCLIAPPSAASVTYADPEVRVGLQKTCTVVLRDLWFYLCGEGNFVISVAVCAPGTFPSSADSTFLYHQEVFKTDMSHDVKVRVPEISHLVVVGSESQALNVFVRIECEVPLPGGRVSCSYHCTSVVDD